MNIGQSSYQVNSLLLNLVTGGLSSWSGTVLNLAWWFAHPLLAVITVIGLLLLLQGLLSLLSSLIRQILLSVVKAPYKLVQWSLSKTAVPFNRFAEPNANPSRAMQDVPERLLQVLTQLEAARREQDKLLQELKTILTISQQEQMLKEVPSTSRDLQLSARGEKDEILTQTAPKG